MTTVDDLLHFLGQSPSPYHAVATAVAHLADAGFTEVDATGVWPGDGNHYLVRGGALVAWSSAGQAPHAPFRVIGAHTDSPNLRVRPRPDTGTLGWRQLAVEVYGGALWNSWLDRDLGLSGRVVLEADGALTERLLLVDRPLARVPQLAIHLDRDVNGKGLALNPQQHLTPVWGTGPWSDGDLLGFVAEHLEVEPDTIGGWDLMFHDLAAPTLLGRDRELLASARLDNLVSCWAGLQALTAASTAPAPPPTTSVLCLFDHEEVGSTSATGADGTLLAHVLERVVLAGGGDRDHLLRALAGSVCASVDMAHATHPNYPERHEPGHHVRIDGGPVVKCNVNQRYATDGAGQAVVVQACEQAGVPHQLFSSRNDQPCGSTIGPATAARLGMATVDLGVAQLSMHSARELCGAADPPRLAAALTTFLGA